MRLPRRTGVNVGYASGTDAIAICSYGVLHHRPESVRGKRASQRHAGTQQFLPGTVFTSMPAFTFSAAANLTRDLNFDGTISGNVYAQPLYIEGGPNGPMIIAVTESNNVYALNATTGTIIWQRNLGAPVPLNRLGCGNIDPVGITSTPVVDLASRALFLMRSPRQMAALRKSILFSR